MRTPISWAGPAAALILSAAAQPSPAPVSGPDALPGLAAGVLGSGDQLVLQIRAQDGAPARTLNIGDAFADGWVLSSLTNATATLRKDGLERTIGLNPTGALDTPAPSGPRSTVRMAGMVVPSAVQAVLDLSDAEVLASMNPGPRAQFDSKIYPGLNLPESQRLALYSQRRTLSLRDMTLAAGANVAAAQAAGINAKTRGATDADYFALLGQDYQDLQTRVWAAYDQQQLAAYELAQASEPTALRIAAGSVMGDLGPNGQFRKLAEVDATGSVYVLTPPTPSSGVGAPTVVPALTPNMVAGLTGPDGAPLDPDTQAAILAANAQRRSGVATVTALNAPPPGAVIYGPLGPDPAR